MHKPMHKLTGLLILLALVVAPVAQAAPADGGPAALWGWLVDSVAELVLPGGFPAGEAVHDVTGASETGAPADPFGDSTTTTTTMTTTDTSDTESGGEHGPGQDPFG